MRRWRSSSTSPATTDLYIFGAGQVAVPMAELAAKVGFRVTSLIPDRCSPTASAFRPPARSWLDFREVAQERKLTQLNFALVLTHRHMTYRSWRFCCGRTSDTLGS
jgi:xanthine/CO dehydrogenase XdhC/CoxF family maturation factor